MPLPEPTPENIKQVQEMIKAPDVTPETKAKMDAWLAKATVPGGHTLLPAGNWVERKMAADAPVSALTRSEMPEKPSLLGELGKSALAGIVGLGHGITGGLENVDIPSPLDTAQGKAVGASIRDKVAHGLANEPGETSTETSERLMAADPLSAGAGQIGSLLVGGLPALVDRGLIRATEGLGLKAGELAIPKAASREVAQAAIAKQAALKAGEASIGKQMGLGAARGAATGLGVGAIEDLAGASDLAANDKPVDMSLEGDKMAIRALLGGGLGAIGGGLGARAAQNLDPSTSAGAGGTAQQIARVRRLGGDIGLGGVETPPSLKPLYQEAMAGGTEITPRIGGLSHENMEAPGTFSPASHVEDVAAEKALGPVQKGIAEVDRGQAQKFQAIDDAFYSAPSVQRQRFVPKKISETLQRFAQARVMDDGTPVPYANSGEPIQELNKLYNVGAPIRGMDKHTELLAAQPGSFALPLEEAQKLGLMPNMSRSSSSAPVGPGEKAFVVITPKQVSPQQFEQAMAGINNAAKAAQVRGTPDALHAELQQAGFRDRENIQWPAEVPWPAGVSREVAFTIPGDRGSTTLRDWAAIQAQKAEKLGNLERDLFHMGTTPAEATNETTGPRAILNSLKTIGQPGSSRAERSLSKFAVNQPGGREALNDMESINAIEGSSGLRKKMGAEGVNPFSAHNRHALGLRLDPAMRAAGEKLPRAGAALPLDDRKAIQMLLGIGTK